MKLLATILSALALASLPAFGQGAAAEAPAADQVGRRGAPKPVDPNWKPTLTSDGQPDIHGIWITNVYGMGCLTDPGNGNVGCVRQSGPAREGGGNRQRKKTASRIIDTPDGEVPYQPQARQRQQYLLSNYFEPTKPEFIDPQQRCLPLGAVRQFTWHDVQILQYPGYVVFEHEGNHVYQIVPLDGRPHLGENIKLWMGDSRGHWEGNTLVIDVTNSNAKGRLSRAGDFSSDKVHNVIRMKFLDANNMRFEATFDDPTVYTRPWTFGFDMMRGIFTNPTNLTEEAYEQWEEACHEGTRDIDSSLLPEESRK